MAATLLGSLLVSLGLESGSFRSGLTDAEKQMRTAQKNFERIGSNFQKVGAGLSLGITAPFTALVTAAVPAAIESQQATAQVTAALNSMGPVAGRTADQLAALASRLQDTSNFDDDDIMKSVTANLLTFGKVQGDVFDRAEQATVDLSARLGQDLQSSAIQVGKALNDPIKGVTALQRVGVSFTAQQKEQIKAMVTAGDVASAQGIILGELEKQFGGAAKAQRDATPGADSQQAWRTFQETVGGVALQVLPALTNAVAGVLNAFNALSPGMQQTIITVGAVGAALGPVSLVFGSLIRMGAPLTAFFIARATEAGALAVAEGTATTATTVFAAALQRLLIATGVGAAILAVGAAVYLVYQRMQEGTTASGIYADGERIVTEIHNKLTEATNRVAAATGKARAEAVAAAERDRQLAVARLNRARAAMIAADAERALAQIAEKKVNQAVTGQGWWGVLNQLPGGNLLRLGEAAVADRRSARSTQAQTNYDASLKTMAGIRAEIDGFDARIRSASAGPSKLAAALDGAGKAGHASLKKIGAGATDAKSKLDDTARSAQALMDRLFPDQARDAEYRKDIADLTKLYKDGKVSVDQFLEARARISRDYDKDRVKDDPYLITEPAVDTNVVDNTGKMISDTWGKVKAENDSLGESFAQTTRNVTSSLQGLMNSIKSGDWLSSLSGLVDVFTQLAGAGVFGKGMAARASSFRSFGGGRAIGGPVLAGTDYLVGERGPEILRMGGASGSIVPNHMLAGPTPIVVSVEEGSLFRPVVRSEAGQVSYRMSAASARSSALQSRQQLA